MNNYKDNLSSVIEAIVYIDNQALKMRDLARECSKNSPELRSLVEEKNKLYKLKDLAMKLLSSQSDFSALGYFEQSLKNSVVSRVYKYEAGGYEIFSVKPYTKNPKQLGSLGEIGYLSPRELNSNMNLEEAMVILKNYLADTGVELEPSHKLTETALKQEGSNASYEIVDRKLVECHRLRLDDAISLDSFSKQVPSLLDLASNSKKKYPDELDLVVSKDKDPENKRRVIYNVKDNFATLLAVRELGLEKVYVNILAD